MGDDFQVLRSDEDRGLEDELEDEVQDLDGDSDRIIEGLQDITCDGDGCRLMVDEEEDLCPTCRDGRGDAGG